MRVCHACDDESSLGIEQAISINKCRGVLFINLWHMRETVKGIKFSESVPRKKMS